jgi:hypothetical protein
MQKAVDSLSQLPFRCPQHKKIFSRGIYHDQRIHH